MTAPRIDVVRKHANAAIAAIAEATEHLEDLHALGWYRHADHRARERVGGSTTDWSLDNHGDPNARAAYEHLGNALLLVHKTATDAVTGALAIFDPGIISSRRDQTGDATTYEIIDALARHDKRRTHGEGGSAPTITQPMPRGANKYLNATALQEELDALRNAVRKSSVRPDRNRLTPRELTAWQTATGTSPTRRKKFRRQ